MPLMSQSLSGKCTDERMKGLLFRTRSPVEKRYKPSKKLKKSLRKFMKAQVIQSDLF